MASVTVNRKNTQYGAMRVNTVRPSTGIYGKHVGGKAPKNAVRSGRR